jgi:hypothetical protein
VADQPNILIIGGDDVGITNVSCYRDGLMGYRTPNVDPLADEGVRFRNYDGDQSCTAGRAAYITRVDTGMSHIGLRCAWPASGPPTTTTEQGGTMSARLASRRPGPTRDAVLASLDGLDDVPIDERVAYLDNDGTMWCEKSTSVQLDFFVDALQARVAQDPSLADRPEFAAVLSGDMAAVGEVGLAKVAGALGALFDGQTPERFGHGVDDFLDRYRHRTLGTGLDDASTSRCWSCSTNCALASS